MLHQSEGAMEGSTDLQSSFGTSSAAACGFSLAHQFVEASFFGQPLPLTLEQQLDPGALNTASTVTFDITSISTLLNLNARLSVCFLYKLQLLEAIQRNVGIKLIVVEG